MTELQPEAAKFVTSGSTIYVRFAGKKEGEVYYHPKGNSDKKFVWLRCWDVAKSCVYYCNKTEKRTSWELPDINIVSVPTNNAVTGTSIATSNSTSQSDRNDNESKNSNILSSIAFDFSVSKSDDSSASVGNLKERVAAMRARRHKTDDEEAF